MSDPEAEYQRLATADPGALRAAAETLAGVQRSLDRAGDDVYAATGTPVWTGGGATSFQARAAGLLQGVQTNHAMVALVGGGLDVAATACEQALDRADQTISVWRNRPSGMPEVVELVWSSMVASHLRGVASDYDAQLAGVLSVLQGDQDVDLDDLDDETREWVEKGLDKTDDWLHGNGSSLGPLIPNTKATGDGRNLTPQGLGYDPASGTLIQSYTDEDGDRSGLALIDNASGQELGEVQLGSTPVVDGRPQSVTPPGHVGGVTVDGDEVLVSTDGAVYTYSLNEIQDAGPGDVVQPTRLPDQVAASSYNTVHEGKLYVGDFYHDVMYVYERKPGGGWTPVLDGAGDPTSIATPPNVQGVAVRDGEIVYSTSHGRGSGSSLIVHDLDGNQIGDEYDLPNMAEGVVEVDGELVVTYESGAQEYQHAATGKWGWLWGVPDDDDLWASTHMTRTPLDELGLAEDLEAEPASLRRAAAQLGDPAASLRSASTTLEGVRLVAADLGQVPTAASLASAALDAIDTSAESLRTGAAATEQLAEGLVLTGGGYDAVDEAARAAMDALRGLFP